MANTKTTNYLQTGKGTVTLMYTLQYVDTATETDTIIYDSSVVATALGITDPMDCIVLSIEAAMNVASTARVFTEFDGTSDTPLVTFVTGNMTKFDFNKTGGFRNSAGAGRTGDILLTATGLGTGDMISIKLVVRPY